MKNPITKIILPLIILLAFSLPSVAQTKYEYAVVTYYPWGRDLMVAIGNDYQEKKVEKDDVKGIGDVSLAIKEIEKMNEQGWEVFETSTSAADTYRIIYTYFLRKKKE